MSASITLSAGVRQNLLSLQNTAALMATTQSRLATGKKVNSALDNPTNYFTAAALNARSSDLSALLDSMSNGIKTLEAANNGITSVTSVVENMQSLVRSARADNTGAATTPGTVVQGAAANSSTALNNKMTFDIGSAIVNITTYSGGAALSDQAIADAINTNSLLKDSVVANVDGSGHLNLANKTGTNIAVTGFSAATGVNGAAATTDTLLAGTPGAISSTRQSLMNQFNDLRTQLDQMVQDAQYNGINLLNGDQLKLTFNETSTSSITIQAKDAAGNAFGALTSTKLAIGVQTTSNFNSNSTLDTLSTTLQTALATLRTQASAYGSNLSTVQNRQDFTKSMMTTLQTGADNLVLADTNEEGANMLALQTRQQLSTTALSLANQANQAVLRLFG